VGTKMMLRMGAMMVEGGWYFGIKIFVGDLYAGVFTGSVYKDFALLRNGFPAESITNGRVLVVKTHESGSSARSLFEKAILLVRKPSEAILAEFNRRAAGHIGHAGRDKYTRNAGRCEPSNIIFKKETLLQYLCKTNLFKYEF